MVVGIVLEGEAAVAERQRLLMEGKEVPLAFRERDAQGRRRSQWLQFGMNSSAAWVYCRDERQGIEARMLLEAVLADEATALFAGYLERMELRRCLIDPSPLSAELVDVNPCVADMVDDLKEVFGIGITLR